MTVVSIPVVMGIFFMRYVVVLGGEFLPLPPGNGFLHGLSHSTGGDRSPEVFRQRGFDERSMSRCHPTLTRGEQTDLKSVRVVKISHKLHAEKKALCIDCHPNIAHDSTSMRTHRPQMETCYHCHQAHPRTQACDKCHPINLVYSPKGKTS